MPVRTPAKRDAAATGRCRPSFPSRKIPANQIPRKAAACCSLSLRERAGVRGSCLRSGRTMAPVNQGSPSARTMPQDLLAPALTRADTASQTSSRPSWPVPSQPCTPCPTATPSPMADPLPVRTAAAWPAAACRCASPILAVRRGSQGQVPPRRTRWCHRRQGSAHGVNPLTPAFTSALSPQP